MTENATKKPSELEMMAQILKDLGVTEYEPRVLHQMKEFGEKYLKTILDDAFELSCRAKKERVDNDDIKLAISLYNDTIYGSQPDRDALLEIAKQRNSLPLPPELNSKLSPSSRMLCSGIKRTYFKKGAKPRFKLKPMSSRNLSPGISKPAAVSMTRPASTPSIKFSDAAATTSSFSPTIASTANSVHQMLMPEEIKVENNFLSTVSAEQSLMPAKDQFLAAASSLSPSVPHILMPDEIKVENSIPDASEQPLMTTIAEITTSSFSPTISRTANSVHRMLMPGEIKVENNFPFATSVSDQPLIPTKAASSLSPSVHILMPEEIKVENNIPDASEQPLMTTIEEPVTASSLASTVMPEEIKVETTSWL